MLDVPCLVVGLSFACILNIFSFPDISADFTDRFLDACALIPLQTFNAYKVRYYLTAATLFVVSSRKRDAGFREKFSGSVRPIVQGPPVPKPERKGLFTCSQTLLIMHAKL